MIFLGLEYASDAPELSDNPNTQAAVKAFARGDNVEFGGALSVAAAVRGASLEGTILIAQSDKNARYYGGRVTPEHILTGRVPPPPSGETVNCNTQPILNRSPYSLGSR